MKLIAKKSTPSDKYDQLNFVRDDGSSSQCSMPRQGILPHDLIHYVVESALPFEFGFLSLVAHGADPTFVMESVHDKNNAQVSAEAVQVEAIVEALQTQLWAGQFDTEMFIYAAEMACTARNTAPYSFAEIEPRTALFEPALALAQEWAAVNFSSTLERHFKSKTSFKKFE